MSVKFEVDVQSQKLEGKLRLFASSLGPMFRGLMAAVGREMVAEARGRAGAAFTSRTGKLLRHIKFIPTEDGGVLTTRDRLNKYKSDAYYSLFLEKGANIKWRKKAGAARIRSRPFMGPVFDEYWEGENAKGYRALAEALGKKLREYMGD
jgi:hypothetical protein